MSKKAYIAVEDIPQNTIFMMEIPSIAFFTVYPKQGSGNFENEFITHFDGDFSQMIYVQKEFEAQCKFLADKVMKKPKWTLSVMKRIEEATTDFFKVMRNVARLNLTNMSDKQIAKLMRDIGKVHMVSHGHATSVTWHSDAGDQLVTKAILEMVTVNLKKMKVQQSVPEVFSILTSPTKRSLLDKEEENFLKIALTISKKRKLKEAFIQSSLQSLTDNLSGLDRQIYENILGHYKQFSPLTYQYRGPAYPLGDYLSRWQAFLREKKNPKVVLEKKKKDQRDLLKEQKKLVEQLELTEHEQNILIMAQEMVFIKSYRKDALYNAMYYYELIFKEVGKRFGLSVGQVQAMKPSEIITALEKGEVDADMLNERLKKAVDYYKRKGNTGYTNTVLTGDKAERFMKSINLKKPKNNKKKLYGTCAYPGKIEGVVRVVNVPEDMEKMKQGDIMVAHNTNPNLVPAMKKASALVGGAGGLTCHTAIVAREMKIPCVVGALNCDKFLKDGDKVLVDAEEGVIKKL